MSPHRSALLLLAALFVLPALASRPNASDMARDAKQILDRANQPFMKDSATKARCNSYLDGMSSAVCSAWGTWQSFAFLNSVTISGATAAGGMVIGPPVYSETNSKAPQGWNCNQAIAGGFNAGFGAWAASVKVPGLRWYPAFAIQMVPYAPPTPNIPCSLNVLEFKSVAMTKGSLKTEMLRKLTGSAQSDPIALAMVDAMAGAIETAFRNWIATTQVTDVIGVGPVPTFAPPVSMSGPVVGGLGTMRPGGFK